ncbi:hypothetical protein QYE76_040069 [Lolium multiflorum]|uniref:Uncharacterized protein n=1 Tax=Lolium multiflorum TaxID=4521 RepID=A0AAD8TB24_LOLMU|nr:hypothetical protein QYE76_040069 [Lolium multiflorum]
MLAAMDVLGKVPHARMGLLPVSTREKHIQSSRLSAHANAHATEVATAVFLDSIFKRDHRINLARPAVDATMMPDGSTIPHAYIIPHLSLIPCNTMPLRLSANNVVDEYHSTTSANIQQLLQKRCPKR